MNVSNYDNDLVKAYYENVAPSLVFVTVTDLNSGSSHCGTATVIGRVTTKAGECPMLATAAHLLPDDPKLETKIKLTRFSFENAFLPTPQTAEFTIPHEGFYLRTSDPDPARNRVVDIALIRGTHCCTDGKPWFTADSLNSFMPVCGQLRWWAEGTEVAWAGFPSIACRLAKRPQPCFYRGVVSSLILHEEFQAYLLDGHNTFGISGGPVWCIDPDTKTPSLMAVIASYHPTIEQPLLPGLVFAVPIQVLMNRFEGYSTGAPTLRFKQDTIPAQSPADL